MILYLAQASDQKGFILKEMYLSKKEVILNFQLYFAACNGDINSVLYLIKKGAQIPPIRLKKAKRILFDEVEPNKGLELHSFESSMTSPILTGTRSDRRQMVLDMVKGIGSCPLSKKRHQAIRRIVHLHHNLPISYMIYVRE